MSKKQLSKSNHENWVVFSQSYLLLARLACQELLDSKHNSSDVFHNPPFPYTQYHLFIPLRYNINHGIEVFIKTLLVILDSGYDDSHDLIKLFNDLKKAIKKENIKSKKCSDGNIITQNDIDSIPKYLVDLEKMIKKYFYNESVSKKHVTDSSNTIYRYPDNKTGIDFNFIQNILPTLGKDDIKKNKNDIDKLIKYFSGLGYIFDIYKYCK